MATVCFVNGLFPPDGHGGAENYVLRVAKAFQKRGHDVSVLTTKPYEGLSSLRPQRSEYEGIPVWRFFPPNITHLSEGTGSNPVSQAIWRQVDIANAPALHNAKRVLERVGPDVVHTNNLTGISTGVGQIVQRMDVTHVHTLHDYSLICPRATLLRDLTAPDDERTVCESPPAPCRLYAKQKRLTLGTPDVVTGPSRHVVDVHQEHGFFKDTRALRIRLGVEDIAEQTPPVPTERSVLYVGKQMEEKGLETLFEAAGRLPDTTFHVCGTGPYADETEKRTDTLDNLQYHGYVTDHRLTELRREAGLAVVPSIWMENSPLTIYESFAEGLPVVGSDIGGIPELIQHGSNGRLFTPKDDVDLAHQMDELLSNPTELERAKQDALEWASKHTMEDHVDRLAVEAYRL